MSVAIAKFKGPVGLSLVGHQSWRRTPEISLSKSPGFTPGLKKGLIPNFTELEEVPTYYPFLMQEIRHTFCNLIPSPWKRIVNQAGIKAVVLSHLKEPLENAEMK